jgi:hypothetical protein
VTLLLLLLLYLCYVGFARQSWGNIGQAQCVVSRADARLDSTFLAGLGCALCRMSPAQHAR